MTTTRCDYCGKDVDSRLVKPVPDWRDGGVACYSCRGTESGDALVRKAAWKEFDIVTEADRIDASRWRALLPALVLRTGKSNQWLATNPWPSSCMVDSATQFVDALVQIAQEKQ